MGVLDKFLDAIKLNDDYDDDELLDDSLLEDEDDYEDDFLDEDDDMEEKPKKKFFEKFSKKKMTRKRIFWIMSRKMKRLRHLLPSHLQRQLQPRPRQGRNVFPDRHLLPRLPQCVQASVLPRLPIWKFV